MIDLLDSWIHAFVLIVLANSQSCIKKCGFFTRFILIPMCAGALSSVPFAVFAINKSNEDHLKIVVGVLTMSMGALTIYKAKA